MANTLSVSTLPKNSIGAPASDGMICAHECANDNIYKRHGSENPYDRGSAQQRLQLEWCTNSFSQTQVHSTVPAQIDNTYGID